MAKSKVCQTSMDRHFEILPRISKYGVFEGDSLAKLIEHAKTHAHAPTQTRSPGRGKPGAIK